MSADALTSSSLSRPRPTHTRTRPCCHPVVRVQCFAQCFGTRQCFGSSGMPSRDVAATIPVVRSPFRSSPAAPHSRGSPVITGFGQRRRIPLAGTSPDTVRSSYLRDLRDLRSENEPCATGRSREATSGWAGVQQGGVVPEPHLRVGYEAGCCRRRVRARGSEGRCDGGYGVLGSFR